MLRGDPSVFEDIDVKLKISNYESDRSTDVLVPALELRITVGTGSSEDRVPDLVVVADGQDVQEGGNAAYPQSWSYLDYPQFRESVDVEFELLGSAFAVTAVPIDAQIQEPVWDGEQLTVRWDGLKMAPEYLRATGSCMALMPDVVSNADATLIVDPTRSMSEPPSMGDPPCTMRLRVEWEADRELAGTPTKSFVLAHSLVRTRIFDIIAN